jgi:hypothetical protein
MGYCVWNDHLNILPLNQIKIFLMALGNPVQSVIFSILYSPKRLLWYPNNKDSRHWMYSAV